MLAILTTHPIQYQTPLWQALAKDGTVPFEVWYLTDFGTRPSRDQEFGRTFSWDIDTLRGYPYRFLETAPGATPTSFWGCRLRERLRDRLKASGVTKLWIQGWQVFGYWQAVWEAQAAGVEVWIRAESNDLAPPASWWKRPLKQILLGQFFNRIRRFLYIGAGNKRLYQSYNVAPENLHAAPYAVDNERFASQALSIGNERTALRRAWGIPDNAFCILFCGKFIPKKRPMDVVDAVRRLKSSHARDNAHLLFVGSGELGDALRAACLVVHDADSEIPVAKDGLAPDRPPASFAGFLNQSEISRAYVAADCLVLPSDQGETWGLVVNEALASGLPCVVSDACGCAEDLIASVRPELTFRLGDIAGLAQALEHCASLRQNDVDVRPWVSGYTFSRVVRTVVSLAGAQSAGRAA